MPKYTEPTNNNLNWSKLLACNMQNCNENLTKEQQIELAYQQAEQFKQDAIMQEEMGLDL